MGEDFLKNPLRTTLILIADKALETNAIYFCVPSSKSKLSTGKLSRLSIDSSGLPSTSAIGIGFGFIAKATAFCLEFSRRAATAKAITALSIEENQKIGQNKDMEYAAKKGKNQSETVP